MNIRYDMICCFVVRPAANGTGVEHLQLLRTKDDFMGGTWQPISGQIEEGETASAAAMRELREETGLVPAEFYKLNRVDIFLVAQTDTLWHRVLFCAIVNRDAQITLNDEHENFRWVADAEAEKLFMWPGDRESIREIRGEILNESLSKPYLRIVLPGLGEL
ncbi:MAG: NUDIX domain-containing protein [Planctomycetota bacterium]|nr:NUDIX domain-containing protein [Planctomycetota bacterium]